MKINCLNIIIYKFELFSLPTVPSLVESAGVCLLIEIANVYFRLD